MTFIEAVMGTVFLGGWGACAIGLFYVWDEAYDFRPAFRAVTHLGVGVGLVLLVAVGTMVLSAGES